MNNWQHCTTLINESIEHVYLSIHAELCLINVFKLIILIGSKSMIIVSCLADDYFYFLLVY